jgi:hypothetical protein
MPKRIHKNNQIGRNAIAILNNLFIAQNHKYEFLYAENPQQFDYGEDGFLLIVDKSGSKQNYLPFAQVKGTTIGNIILERSDFEYLNNPLFVYILFYVDTIERKVKYNFPRFDIVYNNKDSQTLKEKDFKHDFDGSEEAKIQLFENIKKAYEEQSRKARESENRRLYQAGELSSTYGLGNGITAKVINNKIVLSSLKPQIIIGDFTLILPKNSAGEQMKNDINDFINGKKDEVLIGHEYIENFNFGLFDDTQGKKNENITQQIILSVPSIRTFNSVIKIGEFEVEHELELIYSVEKKCFVVRTARGNLSTPFNFELQTNLPYKDYKTVKISLKLNIKNIKKVSEAVYLLQMFNSNGSLIVYEKDRFRRITVFSTVMKNQDGFQKEHLDYLMPIFKVEEYFNSFWEENDIIFTYPIEDYSEDDILQILSLANCIDEPTFFIPQTDETKRHMFIGQQANVQGIYRKFNFFGKSYMLYASGGVVVSEWNEEHQYYTVKLEVVESMHLELV